MSFAAWWSEHEPATPYLDDWTHDDLRRLCATAYAAGVAARPPTWEETAGRPTCDAEAWIRARDAGVQAVRPGAGVTVWVCRCTLPPDHDGDHGASGPGWITPDALDQPTRVSVRWPRA